MSVNIEKNMRKQEKALVNPVKCSWKALRILTFCRAIYESNLVPSFPLVLLVTSYIVSHLRKKQLKPFERV